MDDTDHSHAPRRGGASSALPLVVLCALTGMTAVTVAVGYVASVRSGESTAMRGVAPIAHDSQSMQRTIRRLQMFGPTPEAPLIRHRHVRPAAQAHDTAPMPRGCPDRG